MIHNILPKKVKYFPQIKPLDQELESFFTNIQLNTLFCFYVINDYFLLCALTSTSTEDGGVFLDIENFW